jgi:NADH-quinone oxidoreductase subunit N
MSVETIQYLLPEIILVGLATAIYVAGAFVPARGLWSIAALTGLVVAGFVLAGQPHDAVGYGITSDPLARYGRWLGLMAGLLLVLMNFQTVAAGVAAEFQASLLLATVGLMLTSTASDLVLLFVSLELISIPTYLLLYLARQDNQAKEAAAKYFYLSILSSAVMLYGFSFVYGIAGSTHLERVQAVFLGQTPELTPLARLAPLAIVLLFAGLGFKMAAVPFHFYAPDVYQGTSDGNAALLSVLPKAAALFALVRVVGFGMPGEETLGWRLAMVIGALSMTVGNVLALWQKNVRRLMAYSSIAHIGYMMIGVSTGFVLLPSPVSGTIDGFAAMLFYLSTYALATIGTFAALTYLSSSEQPIETIDDLAGASRYHPLVALALAIFLFSLAGIPPLAGFWGKLTLFFTAINVSQSPSQPWVRAWFAALAVLGVLNAAIAAAYYLRIIGAVWFRTAVAPLRAGGGWAALCSTLIAAVLVLAIGLVPGPLVRESSEATRAGRAGSKPRIAARATASPAASRTTPTITQLP